MVDDRPSKKPRTQSHVVDANAHETIARANSHVQHLFPRQNRWSDAGTAISPTGQLQGQERRSEPRGSHVAELVRYESPATIETSSIPTVQIPHVANGRNSTDPPSATARRLPSLPSPAPSDEHTQSPIIAEGQLGQFGVRRGYSAGKARGRTPAEVGALHMSTVSTSTSASPLSAQSPTFPPYTHQHFTQMGMPQTNPQAVPQPQQGERRQSRQQAGQQAQQQVQFQQQVPWQVRIHVLIQ